MANSVKIKRCVAALFGLCVVFAGCGGSEPNGEAEAKKKAETAQKDEATKLYEEGRKLLFGLDGSKVDVKRGVELLQKAADAGSLDAKGELAFRRVTLHWGVEDYVPPVGEEELDEVRSLAIESAFAGNPFAQITLAICAKLEIQQGAVIGGKVQKLEGAKREKLEEEAKRYGLAGLLGLKKRAEEGDVRAKTWSVVLASEGFLEETGDVSFDAEQAKRWLLEAVESGSAEAGVLLGGVALGGPEEARNNLAALLRAAEAGLPEAMLTAGTVYLMGEAPEFGIKKDEDKGVELLSKAADAGLMSAALFLAKYYEHGGDFDGSEREPDPEKAIEWYIKATECETAKKMVGEELGQIMVKIGRYYLDRLYKTLESKKIYDQKLAKEARKWFYRAEAEGYGSERWIKELDEIKKGVEEEGEEMGITIIE